MQCSLSSKRSLTQPLVVVVVGGSVEIRSEAKVIYNIGNHQPAELMHLIETLETCLGTEAKKNFLPMQPGDVPETFADVDDLVRDVDFQPRTPLEEGVARFVAWYREYHGR